MDLKDNLSDEFLKENKIDKCFEKNYPNLYLLKYEKTTDDSYYDNPIIREARGIILEKDTNKIICYGLNKFNKKPETLDLTDCTIEEAIEGTQIRLYYYNNEWISTTARRITAKRSKWNYVKTFYDLFKDVENYIDYEKLDKNHTYTFIMKHIENRIVSNVTKNELIHIHTRDNETLQELDIDIGIKKPEQFNYTKDELLNKLKDLTFEVKGFVIKDNDNRYMYHTENYDYVKNLKGNNYNDTYNYLYLLQNNKLNEFISYFPENKLKFSTIKKTIDNLCTNIQQLYFKKHVKKETIEIPNNYKDIIYKLHGKHLNEKTIITYEVVRDYIYNLKIGLLVHILKKN